MTGFPIRYRFDGNIFNLRRLQAKTKVQTDVLDELLYADDIDKNDSSEAKCSHGSSLTVMKKKKCSIRVAKTKALISFAATTKLICVFVFAYADCAMFFAYVFAYADCWFSHQAAQKVVGRRGHHRLLFICISNNFLIF